MTVSWTEFLLLSMRSLVNASPQLLIRPGMEEKISTKSIRPGIDIDDVLWFKIKLKTFEMK